MQCMSCHRTTSPILFLLKYNKIIFLCGTTHRSFPTETTKKQQREISRKIGNNRKLTLIVIFHLTVGNDLCVVPPVRKALFNTLPLYRLIVNYPHCKKLSPMIEQPNAQRAFGCCLLHLVTRQVNYLLNQRVDSSAFPRLILLM